MQFSALSAFAAAILIPTALASPLPASQDATTTTSVVAAASYTPYVWNEGESDAYTIYQTCNVTNRNQLLKGFENLKEITAHARDHILRFGNSSEIFIRYFGQAASAEPLGWYAKFVDGDKGKIVFRCDDIDGFCSQNPTWGGYWRGVNGTNEIVMCDISYSDRLYNDQMCTQGYTIAEGDETTIWSGDLMHRVMHTESFGELVVKHYAETYAECLQLAKNNTAQAVRNIDSIRLFAMEAYAYDIAVPGVGCLGTLPNISS